MVLAAVADLVTLLVAESSAVVDLVAFLDTRYMFDLGIGCSGVGEGLDEFIVQWMEHIYHWIVRL